MWLMGVLLVLVSLPLVFGNAGHELTRGLNEEIGIMLVLVAVAMTVAGLAVRGSMGRWDARVALGGVGVIVLGVLVMFIMMLTSGPDHSLRTLQWEQVDETAVIVLSEGELPAQLAADLRAASAGAGGYYTMEGTDYDSFWAMLEARGAREEAPVPGVVVGFEGRAFRVTQGPVM